MTVAIATITEAEVDESIARVIHHVESIWDEWAWQVENKTWLIKGYGSWDEMRQAVYGHLSNITAPRAERPELVSRFRTAGLTQKETAATLGVTEQTVYNDQRKERDPKYLGQSPEPDVIDAEVIEDDGRTLTLINDLRGPWANGLCREAEAMTKMERELVAGALRDVLDRLESMK